MTRKRKRKTPFAWFNAFLFMGLLTLAPVIGARVVAESFGGRSLEFEVTPEAVAATRDAIDRRFRLIMQNTPDRRGEWSRLVGEEVEAGRLATARGYLLAAPYMLDDADARALQAAAFAQELAGDEALAQAALAYLSKDVRSAYERATSPVAAVWRVAVGDQEASSGQAQDIAGAASSDDGVVQLDGRMTDGEDESDMGLNVLGDSRDLALKAARWVRGDRIDTFAFTLSGLGLTVMDSRARSGASVVRSAYRAHRLNPDLAADLERLLFMAAPPERLHRRLTSALSGTLGAAAQGPLVEQVFRDSYDPERLVRLEEELHIIRAIAQKTSPAATISLLENAQSGADLRRARLLALAGGDKALALMSLDGNSAFDAAQTLIPWTNRLRLMIAALVAIALVLIWLMLDTLVRSFTRARPVRRSAVYALEEPEWFSHSKP